MSNGLWSSIARIAIEYILISALNQMRYEITVFIICMTISVNVDCRIFLQE